MQPEIRFNGFSDEWVEKKLGDVFKKESVKNSQLNYGPSQIISLANLYYKNDLDKVPSDSYMKTYNEFKVGDIAFEGNKNKNYKYGRFVANTLGDGVISHVFEVYRAKVAFDTRYLSEFINYEPIMGRILRRTTKSTTMMTSLVSSDFLKETVQLPTLPEQQKIGALFSKYDAIIGLREQKLAELNALKKGLLQQMFDDGVTDEHTPQVRFSGFNDEWVEKKLGEVLLYTASKKFISNGQVGTKYPVVQQGDDPIKEFSDQDPFMDFENVVLFGDHTRSLYKPDIPFLIATDGVKILSSKFIKGNYLLYLILKHVPESQGYKRHLSILKNQSVTYSRDLNEQQKIGQLFKHFDACISNEQTKIELLKAQKQGLLQRML